MGRTRFEDGKNLKGEDGLTERERRFVQFYDGNASEAARLAGYGEGQKACVILHRPAVAAAIKAQGAQVLQRKVKTKQARLRALADIFLDDGEKTADRLKAADMIMRACGDFLEKGIMLHVGMDKEKAVESNGWLKPTASEAQQTVEELLKLNIGPPLLEKSG